MNTSPVHDLSAVNDYILRFKYSSTADLQWAGQCRAYPWTGTAPGCSRSGWRGTWRWKPAAEAARNRARRRLRTLPRSGPGWRGGRLGSPFWCPYWRLPRQWATALSWHKCGKHDRTLDAATNSSFVLFTIAFRCSTEMPHWRNGCHLPGLQARIQA